MITFKRGALLVLIATLLAACATVPLTGRSQLNLVPASTMLGMSVQQYQEFLGSHEVIRSGREAQMVQRVGKNIQMAVDAYMRANGMGADLDNYSWEFNLVKDEAVNAWCMPGGKVVVFTGILPVTENEAGLAVVMGHEIAHAIAAHGNERMSQMLMAQMGGMALTMALQKYPEQTQNMWMQAVGLGVQLGVMLPYSRLHEKEADRLGLVFMAMAGYDPNAAVPFWGRMAEKGGGAPPEFLSTHPAPATRIENIQSYIPEAMAYYRK